MSSVLVAGLGNELRGDDAAGLLAARALVALGVEDVDVEEHEGDVTALAESMARHKRVIVVDAVQADVPPGTVLELNARDVGSHRSRSSHGLGLGVAIELARIYGGHPDVEVIGIAGDRYELNARPSGAVVRAAAEVAQSIEERIRCA